MKQYLIYISQPSESLNENELQTVLLEAQERNSSKGISGVILRLPGYFVQYLEGPAAQIEELFLKIRADHRHQYLLVLDQGFSEDSLFPQWSMGVEEGPHWHAGLQAWLNKQAKRDIFGDFAPLKILLQISKEKIRLLNPAKGADVSQLPNSHS